MTHNRAKALEAFDYAIERITEASEGNGGLVNDAALNAYFMLKDHGKKIREALTEPKWKTMDDIRAYDGQEIDILLNGNARIPNVYFDDDLQQFLSAGTDVPVIIDGDPINEITHWMHLPDAPTGGES